MTKYNKNFYLFLKRREFILIALVALLFFLMNRIIPFFGDDTYSLYKSNQLKFTTFKEVFVEMSTFSTSRYLCNFFSIFFIKFLGNMWFDIFNTIMFILIIYGLGEICIPKEAKNRLFGWVVLIILFFSLSTGKDALFYWCVGSLNYLLPLLLSIIYLKLLHYIYANDIKATYIKVFLLFILSLVINLHHELFVAVMIGGLTLYTLTNFREIITKRNINIYAMYLGLCLAAIILIFSGSTLSKAAPPDGSSIFSFAELARRFGHVFLEIRIGYIFLFVCLISFFVDRKETIFFIKKNLFWIFSLACSVVPPVVGGQGGGRVVFVTEIISIVLLIRFSYFIHVPDQKYLNVGSNILAGLFLIFMSVVIYDSSIKWKIFDKTMNQYVNQSSNLVLADDYKGIKCEYTFDLHQMFSSHYYEYGYQWEKAYRLGVSSYSVSQVAVMPMSVYNVVNGDSFFSVNTPISGDAEFYSIAGTDYYVRKYSPDIKEKISEGRLAIKSTCNVVKDNLFNAQITNTTSELNKRNVIQIINDNKIGHYILYNNSETKIPFTKVTSIFFENPRNTKSWFKVTF